MAIVYNGELQPVMATAITKTIMVGDRLFVFSDGTGLPRGEQPQFAVYDDGGNVVINPQSMTDATQTQLDGYVYFGVFLPYFAQIDSIEMGSDGSFALNFSGDDPSVYATNIGARSAFSDTRYFTPDGAPLDARPASMTGDTLWVGGNNGSANATDGGTTPLLDLGDTVATAFVSQTTKNIRLQLDSGNGKETVFISPSGESSFSTLPATPASVALAKAGENVLLVYQDTASRDVFVRLYDISGDQIGSEFVLGGTDNTSFNRPLEDNVQALTLADGTIVVTWSNQRTGIDTSPELFKAHLAADGTILRGPEMVNTDLTSGTQYDGQIFALSDGGYAIVYNTIGGSPYRQEALVRQYNADGTPVGGSVAFEDVTPGQSLNAHFAQVFPNGFGYMIDGFGTEYTIQIGSGSGTGEPPIVIDDVALGGQVTGTGGATLAGVELTVLDAGGVTLATLTSDAAGRFSTTLPDGEAARLDASRDYDPGTDPAISALDALDVLRLAVGLAPSFGDAQAQNFVAADINADGAVTALDALEVLRAAVGIDSAHAPRWAFFDATADWDAVAASRAAVNAPETGIDLSGIAPGADLAMTGILLGNMEVTV